MLTVGYHVMPSINSNNFKTASCRGGRYLACGVSAGVVIYYRLQDDGWDIQKERYSNKIKMLCLLSTKIGPLISIIGENL